MMRVVTVMPLERSVWTDTLTYFSAQEIRPGNIVAIPLRKKILPALVTGVRNASDDKASIKASSVGLRKISRVLHKNLFSAELIKAVEETSRFYATSPGNVLASLTPIPLLKKLSAMEPFRPAARKTSRAVTQISQTDDESRFTEYRSLVRESFRHKESLLVLVPTIQDAENAYALLSKGIDAYTLVLHSDRGTKQLSGAFTKLHNNEHPLLIIATPGFLGLLLDYVGTVIVERENSPAYKHIVRPYVDFRFLVSAYARNAKIRLILGDVLLSTETMNAYRTHIYDEVTPPQWRLAGKTKAELVDMRAYKPNLRGKVKIISDRLSALIQETRQASERIFIFAARKGLSPATLCGDCGSILHCPACSHPVVLHKIAGHKRLYLCHRCGTTMDPATRCKTCTSWKLVTLGIGSELVEEELSAAFPNLPIMRFDRESVKDRRQALALVEKFYEKSPCILIGTEIAIPYLKKPVSTVAVASIDELFLIPDYRIHERIAYLLYKLRGIAEHNFLLQTRSADNPVVRLILEGNASSLLEQELAIRKTLLYPPFSVPIKITWFGKPQVLKKEMEGLAAKLLPHVLNIFPVLEKYPKGRVGLSGIVKMPIEKWPDDAILEILKNLPPSVQVNVDPVSFS